MAPPGATSDLDMMANRPRRTYWDEMLDAAAHIVAQTPRSEFIYQDLIAEMRRRATRYHASTIRTHLVTRCCANAPPSPAHHYDDFFRVRDGVYRLFSATHQA